jgi:serine/threonine protein kinase
MYRKVYNKKNFYGNENETISRILNINSLNYPKYNSLVRTSIHSEKDFYLYEQDFLQIIKPYDLSKDMLFTLSDSLNYLDEMGFVHGDLNRKNIVFTKSNLKVIDLEPSLYQIKNNKRCLMITMPYISKFDLKNRVITNRTDKLGFIYFILRVNHFLSSKDIVDLSQDLEHSRILQLTENELDEMDYYDLVNYAYKLFI